MIQNGILNLAVASLLRRVRHTNTLAIADRGFPSWSDVETIDLSLVDDVPTVLQVLGAILADFKIGKAWIAEEFLAENDEPVQRVFYEALSPVELLHEPHVDFKRRILACVGLIRTGDTTQYANIVLESA